MPMATPPDNSIKKAALLVATMVSFVSPFMGAASNIALPTIGKQFGMDAVVLSWVATSFLLSSAIFLVPFGRLADIFGRKRIFLWGVSIFTLNSIGCGVSASAGGCCKALEAR
jgi:MFS family permease